VSHRFRELKRSYHARRSEFLAAAFLLCVLCAAAIFFLIPSVAAEEHSSSPLVVELRLEGVVDPIWQPH